MKIIVTPKPKDVSELLNGHIKAVINVNDSPDYLFSSPKPYYWFPVHECFWWGYAPFYGALKVCEQHQDGVVVIHCAAGVNRSPSIAYAVMKTIGGGEWSLDHNLSCGGGWIWGRDRLRRNMDLGYVPSDVLRFLGYAFTHPDASLMEALFRINSPNLVLGKESEITSTNQLTDNIIPSKILIP